MRRIYWPGGRLINDAGQRFDIVGPVVAARIVLQDCPLFKGQGHELLERACQATEAYEKERTDFAPRDVVASYLPTNKDQTISFTLYMSSRLIMLKDG